MLPRWGRVIRAEGAPSWLLVADDGRPVEPVRLFLRDFTARGNRSASVRSYAYDLLRWWRWLQHIGADWDRVTSVEVREFVLWLQQATKPRRNPRTVSTMTAGTVNPLTRKPYLDDHYQARSVRHSNAVLRSFYEFWLENGGVPVVNPVPLCQGRGRRPNAHHDPLEPYRGEGQVLYNPRVPRRTPRALSDEQWSDLFAALGSNRDRALLTMTVSTAARAGEVLGLRGVDIDWGEQLVRVVRKGTRAEQWLPASPEAFVWLRLYLAESGDMGVNEPVWWTLRRHDHGTGLRRQPFTYEALRAVFRRANVTLGTNWSMHDLRHTASLRMAQDEHLSLRDVQTILGHAHLSTTSDVYLIENEASVARRVLEHLSGRDQRTQERCGRVAAGYDSADLSVLFGNDLT